MEQRGDYCHLCCRSHKIGTWWGQSRLYNMEMDELVNVSWNPLIGPPVLKDIFAGSNIGYAFSHYFRFVTPLFSGLVCPCPGIFDPLLVIACDKTAEIFWGSRWHFFSAESWLQLLAGTSRGGRSSLFRPELSWFECGLQPLYGLVCYSSPQSCQKHKGPRVSLCSGVHWSVVAFAKTPKLCSTYSPGSLLLHLGECLKGKSIDGHTHFALWDHASQYVLFY